MARQAGATLTARRTSPGIPYAGIQRSFQPTDRFGTWSHTCAAFYTVTGMGRHV